MHLADTIEELKSKAEKGSAPCQIELGHSYLMGADYSGEAFRQDYAQARYWLQRAHELGAATATLLLGTMYQDGKGMRVDIPTAVELYTAASERGSYLACVFLARIYRTGKGGMRSETMAADWYRKAMSFEEEVDDADELNEAREFLRAHKVSR